MSEGMNNSRSSTAAPARSTATTSEQMGEPAYYVFPGIDVTDGLACEEDVIGLRPGDTLVIMVSDIGSRATRLNPAGCSHIDVSHIVNVLGEAVISIIPAERLFPYDSAASIDTGSGLLAGNYHVTNVTRIWAKSSQSVSGALPVLLNCRLEQGTDRVSGLDMVRLYPPAEGSLAFLEVETRDDHPLRFDVLAGSTLEITPDPTIEPSRLAPNNPQTAIDADEADMAMMIEGRFEVLR